MHLIKKQQSPLTAGDLIHHLQAMEYAFHTVRALHMITIWLV